MKYYDRRECVRITRRLLRQKKVWRIAKQEIADYFVGFGWELNIQSMSPRLVIGIFGIFAIFLRHEVV